MKSKAEVELEAVDAETEVLTRFELRIRRKLADIDVHLKRAVERRNAYFAKGDLRSYDIQENVIDRLLRDRYQVRA